MRSPLAFVRTSWDKSLFRTRFFLSTVSNSKQLSPANTKCEDLMEINDLILHILILLLNTSKFRFSYSY